MALKSARKLWLQLHLYLGLFLGAVLAVAGLTGSLLVFWSDIDDGLNPSLRVVAAHSGGEAAFRPLDNIMRAAGAALPPGAHSGFAYYPRDAESAFQIFYAVPRPAGKPDQYQAFVDPYTAQVTGTRLVLGNGDFWPRAFMPFVFQLHYSLLSGQVGTILVGVVAVFLLLVSVPTGLYLWWPLRGKWLQAVTLKRGASPERLNFDLHKLGGLYTFPVLVAVLVSGVSMNLPEQFYWAVERFSPLSPAQRDEITSGPAEGRKPIGLDAAAVAEEPLDRQGRIAWMSFPEDETGVYRICRKDVPGLGRFVATRCTLVDQYSGKVLAWIDPETGTAGDLFLQWQGPLHSGQAFGWTGRILVFLTGLACPLLYVTGIIRWLQKRRAKRSRAEHPVCANLQRLA